MIASIDIIVQDDVLNSMDLAQYAVKGTEADWEAATKKKKKSSNNVGTVSIKSKVCFVFVDSMKCFWFLFLFCFWLCFQVGVVLRCFCVFNWFLV